MDSSWKNSWHTFFFLSELSLFLELCPFEKIRLRSDACHILRTVHARVLKFHTWIPHGKIADPYISSCPSYIPFWSYAPLKNQNGILSARDLKKYLIQGLESWSADRGWWIDYLIKLKKKILKSFYFSGVTALWKFWHFNPSHAAIKISINATAAEFICKNIFPIPVQIKKIIKNKTGDIQQIYLYQNVCK